MASGAALTIAVLLYLFEVVSRYVFDAPTTWSGEIVQYCLSAIIFLALPEITRQKAHIVIDIIPAALSGRAVAYLARANGILASLACGVAGGIAALEAWKQFDRGLMTNAAHPIPRWLITAMIAIGLISAALHLLRNVFECKEITA